MTIQELEQRVLALEQTVAQLEAKVAQKLNGVAAHQEPAASPEESLIPDVEYPLVLNVPPKEEFEVKARIVSVERGEQSLALSDAEWESLGLEIPDD